jgi:hypothetical protein
MKLQKACAKRTVRDAGSGFPRMAPHTYHFTIASASDVLSASNRERTSSNLASSATNRRLSAVTPVNPFAINMNMITVKIIVGLGASRN